MCLGFKYGIHFRYSSAAMADGGQRMGCVSSMSAPSNCSCGTLERIFSLFWTARRTRRRRFTNARCTYVDKSAQNDGRASKLLDCHTLRNNTARTWVFMAIHMEEMTDKRTTCDPGSSPAWRRSPTFGQLKQQMCRDIVRRTWEAL